MKKVNLKSVFGRVESGNYNFGDCGDDLPAKAAFVQVKTCTPSFPASMSLSTSLDCNFSLGELVGYLLRHGPRLSRNHHSTSTPRQFWFDINCFSSVLVRVCDSNRLSHWWATLRLHHRQDRETKHNDGSQCSVANLLDHYRFLQPSQRRCFVPSTYGWSSDYWYWNRNDHCAGSYVRLGSLPSEIERKNDFAFLALLHCLRTADDLLPRIFDSREFAQLIVGSRNLICALIPDGLQTCELHCRRNHFSDAFDFVSSPRVSSVLSHEKQSWSRS